MDERVAESAKQMDNRVKQKISVVLDPKRRAPDAELWSVVQIGASTGDPHHILTHLGTTLALDADE